MSDDNRGWVEAAKIDSPLVDNYDEADRLAKTVSGDFRVIEHSKTGGHAVERLTTYDKRWVAVAAFTCGDAVYEWADELQAMFDEDYRCVVEKGTGDVLIERQIDD